MLSHAKLPKSYWVEAMLMVVYLINRFPSVPLKGDVPQRVWTGRHVSYQHLRVFGCIAYICMLQKFIGQNWTSPSHAYSWGTQMMSSATSYGISLTRKWWGVLISYSWKTKRLKTRDNRHYCLPNRILLWSRHKPTFSHKTGLQTTVDRYNQI